MFAWRKRKPRDEEDSLVPHGMIWQAIEDEMSPARAERTQSEAAEKAKVVEMQRPPSDPVRDPSPENNREVKLGAISPPLQWPSPRIQEIAKWARPHVQRESPAVESAPPPIPPVQPEALSSPAVQDPVASLVEPETVSAPVSPESVPQPDIPRISLRERLRPLSDNFRGKFASVRTAFRSVFSAAFAALRGLEARAQNFYRAAEMRRQVRRAEELAARSNEPQPVVEAEPEITATQPVETHVAVKPQKSKERLNQLGAWVHAQSTRSTEGLRRMWSFKVRVRIQAPELIGIREGMARVISQRGGNFNPRPDPRLRTSMAMAALSALLALAVINGVRRYGAEPGPSNVSASSPATTSSQPAALLPQEPSPSKAAMGARTHTAAAPAAVKQASLSAPQVQTTPKATPRKRHHNPDEAYVAKDTYVYYGPSGKPSR